MTADNIVRYKVSPLTEIRDSLVAHSGVGELKGAMDDILSVHS